MELNGREVHFRRTIWATNAVMQMCPDSDISKFGDLLNGTAPDQILTMAAFLTILSEGYEQAKEFEERRKGNTYTKDPITMDEIMALEDMDVFNQLQTEAVGAWIADAKQTVESQPPKSKKKQKA